MPQNNNEEFDLEELRDNMFKMMARDKAILAKANRNLFILAMALLIALFGTNVYWIWSNSQWDYTTSITETKDNGNAIVNSGDGEVSIGKDSNQNQNKE